MIMMGPKKDKGAMIVSIMEKFKKPNRYEEGKKSNEDLMEKVDMILPMNTTSQK